MKLFSKLFITGILIVTFGILSNGNEVIAQIQGQQGQNEGDNVVEVVKSQDDSHFAELLDETDMPKVLSQQGPFTVLVPSDDALESMETDVEALKQDPQEAQNLVSGHLYQGNLSAQEVEEALNVEIVEGDLEASNGVVHIVDEVIRR